MECAWGSARRLQPSVCLHPAPVTRTAACTPPLSVAAPAAPLQPGRASPFIYCALGALRFTRCASGCAPLQGAQAGSGARLHAAVGQGAARCAWLSRSFFVWDPRASHPVLAVHWQLSSICALNFAAAPACAPSPAAIGLCNFFAAAFSTVPTAGSISRAAVVNSANGKTRERAGGQGDWAGNGPGRGRYDGQLHAAACAVSPAACAPPLPLTPLPICPHRCLQRCPAL